jgi:hypothetical protein
MDESFESVADGVETGTGLEGDQIEQLGLLLGGPLGAGAGAGGLGAVAALSEGGDIAGGQSPIGLLGAGERSFVNVGAAAVLVDLGGVLGGCGDIVSVWQLVSDVFTSSLQL